MPPHGFPAHVGHWLTTHHPVGHWLKTQLYWSLAHNTPLHGSLAHNTQLRGSLAHMMLPSFGGLKRNRCTSSTVYLRAIISLFSKQRSPTYKKTPYIFTKITPHVCHLQGSPSHWDTGFPKIGPVNRETMWPPIDLWPEVKG